MRKEWILTEEEKCLKRRKIEQNRAIKHNTQLVPHQTKNDVTHTDLTVYVQSNEVSSLDRSASRLLSSDLLSLSLSCSDILKSLSLALLPYRPCICILHQISICTNGIDIF